MKYIKVAIIQKGNSIDSLFTYICEEEEVKVGDVVFVPFGMGNRRKKAVVFDVTDQAETAGYKLKAILQIDRAVSLPEELIKLCEWIKERYLCSYTEALGCCIPPDIKKQRERIPHKDLKPEIFDINALTAEQNNALYAVRPHIQEERHKTFLLHGVTGSGKTEVYLQVIQQAREMGKTAIVLVPEISLTIQTISRFKGRFGQDEVAILHSKLSAGERFDEWMRIRSGAVKIVIGVRSAIFAPMQNIGAIIIDEEHEGTYKSEQSPKYDAIEIARQRSLANNAVLILGSATPSVVSFYRSMTGEYSRLTLTERYNKNPLPIMQIADMREELKNGNKTMFSVTLYHEIKNCIQKGQSVILFLNKRGYSSFVSCRSCGFVVKCKDCGLSMTYHKAQDKVACHFCGHQEKVPKICPSCDSKYIRHFGVGTEKLEEATRELFPETTIGRLDLDTSKRKGSTEAILSDFKKGKLQILIGTQIVAKGLDFRHVGLVGIVAADLSLYIPDYRSAERTYQLITQAAGRAGRGSEQGKVVIQSYGPESPAIQCALTQDYEALFQEEIALRRQAGYPPFIDIIRITVSTEDETTAEQAAAKALRMLIEALGKEIMSKVLGPKPAYLYKIKDRYRHQMIIKCELEDRCRYMEELAKIKKVFYSPEYEGYQFLVDINPYGAV